MNEGTRDSQFYVRWEQECEIETIVQLGLEQLTDNKLIHWCQSNNEHDTKSGQHKSLSHKTLKHGHRQKHPKTVVIRIRMRPMPKTLVQLTTRSSSIQFYPSSVYYVYGNQTI
ncbi:hypothetical protein BLOT_006974 [Blomia tropicalis]|nr:hypothetical protein BLOT_006974 [Blomia tropicalis]